MRAPAGGQDADAQEAQAILANPNAYDFADVQAAKEFLGIR